MWLVTQASILAAAPVSLLEHSPHAADAIACTCAHTGHDECPMHHPRASDTEKNFLQKRRCQCRSAQDPDAASLVSLLGPIAVMPHAIAPVAAPPITQLPTYPLNKFAVHVVAPDGPPPRA
jgi:hypothetical protein